MIRNQLEGESSNDEAMNDENLVNTVRISVSCFCFVTSLCFVSEISVHPVEVYVIIKIVYSFYYSINLFTLSEILLVFVFHN